MGVIINVGFKQQGVAKPKGPLEALRPKLQVNEVESRFSCFCFLFCGLFQVIKIVLLFCSQRSNRHVTGSLHVLHPRVVKVKIISSSYYLHLKAIYRRTDTCCCCSDMITDGGAAQAEGRSGNEA